MILSIDNSLSLKWGLYIILSIDIMSGTVIIGEHMFQLEVFWGSRRKKEERTSDILNLHISVRSSFSECRVSEGGEWRMGWKWQTSDKQSLELSRVCWCILFRKTKNIILNTRIILQLKKPALASHSSVPEVWDSMRQNSKEPGFCPTWKFLEFVLARPAPCLPSPPRLSASSQGCRPSFF